VRSQHQGADMSDEIFPDHTGDGIGEQPERPAEGSNCPNTAAAADKCSRGLGSLPNWNTLQINGRVDPP
jgi:hypothetical protein